MRSAVLWRAPPRPLPAPAVALLRCSQKKEDSKWEIPTELSWQRNVITIKWCCNQRCGLRSSDAPIDHWHALWVGHTSNTHLMASWLTPVPNTMLLSQSFCSPMVKIWICFITFFEKKIMKKTTVVSTDTSLSALERCGIYCSLSYSLYIPLSLLRYLFCYTYSSFLNRSKPTVWLLCSENTLTLF